MTRRGAVAVSVLASVLGCSNPVGSAGDRLVTRAAIPHLYLTNESAAPIYAVVFDESIAALVDWVPCTDPSTCGGIAPGATTAIRYDSILGFDHSSGKAIVYWWHLVPADPQAYRPDSIRSLTVRLW